MAKSTLRTQSQFENTSFVLSGEGISKCGELDSCLALAFEFIHFVCRRKFYPSLALNPKSTIAFPTKKYYCIGTSPKPQIRNL